MANTTSSNAASSGPSKTTGRRGSQAIDVASLERVSMGMKLHQMKKELRHRKPDITGIANKNKKFCLDKLGDGSLHEGQYEAATLNGLPRVTADCSAPELSCEFRVRQPGTASSGNPKPWFLDELVIGTILLTSKEFEVRMVSGVLTKKKEEVSTADAPVIPQVAPTHVQATTSVQVPSVPMGSVPSYSSTNHNLWSNSAPVGVPTNTAPVVANTPAVRQAGPGYVQASTNVPVSSVRMGSVSRYSSTNRGLGSNSAPFHFGVPTVSNGQAVSNASAVRQANLGSVQAATTVQVPSVPIGSVSSYSSTNPNLWSNAAFATPRVSFSGP